MSAWVAALGCIAGEGPVAVRRRALMHSSGRRVSALGLSALMVGSGVLHFVITGTYARIVPPALGDPQFWVRLSGVAEIGCGVLVLVPRTRRLGGWATALLLVGVFPANIQMAVDAGTGGSRFPLNSAGLVWARLPLQLPLIAWAVSVARGAALEARAK